MEPDVAMATYVYEECWIDTDKKKRGYIRSKIKEMKERRL